MTSTTNFQAKKELASNSALLDVILNLSGACVFFLDKQGNLKQDYNSAALFSNLSQTPAAREKTFFLKQIVQILRNKIDRLSAAGQAQFFSLEVAQKESFRTLSAGIQALADGYVVLLNDITEKRKFEENLQSNERRFRIILESASQGILATDINGQILMVNTQIEKMFGYTRQELLHQPVEILIPAIYRDAHIRNRNKYILQPVPRQMAAGIQINAQRKDGTAFPVEVNLSSVELHDGLHVLAFITDISEKKNFEQKIRRMEKLEAIGQLAGGIAHDFNNVLAGIIGLSELALRKIPQKNPAQQNIKLIIEKSQNAAGLVSKLLAFSRQQVIAPQKLNLNTIIQSNKQLLQRYLGEDIRLQTTLDKSLLDIEADPSAIDQIITNLCINARDAMPDGGDLFIETSNLNLKDEPLTEIPHPSGIYYVKLTISDNGIGMPRDIQRHIFEPFFTTKEIGHGTGLGLSTVYGLVQQHDGVIQFKSAPGDGTVFTIYFPAFRKTIMQEKHKTQQRVISKGEGTLLLVDDEPDILHSLKVQLTTLGYNVITAEDGLQAKNILQRKAIEIDLVISDVIMPHMGGIELQMFAEALKPDIRFLFISAFNDKLDPDIFYLQKPFAFGELARKINEILTA